MLEDIRVRLERHISKPSSDISPNWKDMRSEFGYDAVSAIVEPNSKSKEKWKKVKSKN